VANQDTLKANWDSITGAVKEKFDNITREDLNHVKGNFEAFATLLQRKAGQTRQQVERLIDDSSHSGEGLYHKASESVNEMAHQAGDYLKGGFEVVREKYESAMETIEQGYDSAYDMVERRPMETITCVAGVGLLAGVLLGISLSSRK
jgi:uncharacterized protein YjbJ (UPF0337 family)